MGKDIAGGGGLGVAQELTALCASLSAGTRLPATRELQRRHHASAATVQRVLADLARRGLLVVTAGRGSYVAATRTARAGDLAWQTTALGSRTDLDSTMERLYTPVPEGLLDLASAYLDPTLQPTGLLAAAATRAARRPHAWDRSPVQGLPELRAHLAAMVGPGYGVDDVVITNGGQSALALAFRALASPGDPVLFEHTTYPGALAAARCAGLHPVPVVSDAYGVLPDALSSALKRTGARVAYLQPRHANPTGSVLAVDRRPDVLAALGAHDAFAIEDDWVSLLDLSGVSPPPLASADDDGHVVHLLSLTKPVAPGLRIAALTSRGAATRRLRRARLGDDLFVAPMLQQTALEVLTAPSWTRHLAGLRRELRVRRDTLLSELARSLPGLESPRVPSGGVHLWLPLPDGVDDVAVVEAARGLGLAVSPGSAFTLGEQTTPHLRLSYSRTAAPGLRESADRLAKALAQVS